MVVLKKNGSGKSEIDKEATWNFYFKFLLVIVTGIAAYFAAIQKIHSSINKIEASIKVQSQIQNTIKEDVVDVKEAVGECADDIDKLSTKQTILFKKVDSLAVEIKHFHSQ